MTLNSRRSPFTDWTTARRATLIWLVVSVPVLSEQITVVQPNVSTDGKLHKHKGLQPCLIRHAWLCSAWHSCSSALRRRCRSADDLQDRPCWRQKAFGSMNACDNQLSTQRDSDSKS